MHRFVLWSTALGGFACMIASGFFAWFLLPVTVAEADGRAASIGPEEPGIVRYFQVGTSIVAVTLLCLWILKLRGRHFDVILASTSLVAVLLFPHLLMVWEPAISARATWLQMQHENLTWFGGDVFKTQEFRQLPSKARLFAEPSPRQVAVMKLPTWSVHEIGLHRLPFLVEWLGYTNTFCQFSSCGWSLAVIGNIGLLLTLLFQGGRLQMSRIHTAVWTLTVTAILACSIVWERPIYVSRVMASAAEYTSQGDYLAAANQLTRAASLWPPLKEDTWYVSQLGLLDHLTGHRSWHARLYEATLLDRTKNSELAWAAYAEIAAKAPAHSAVRREACRGLLRHAIQAMNSGQINKAVSALRQTIAIEPCNIKSLYALHLAHFRLGDYIEIVAANDQFEQTYRYLSFPNKHIVLAAAKEMAFHASFDDERLGNAFEHAVKMRHR